MGSGKSTLGKKLATLLRLRFVDLDNCIEKKENTRISSIFETQGETVFRQKETECLREVVASEQPLVIALGGGTICFNDNLAYIKQHGLLVYLELPVEVLAGRVQNSKKERPLLKNLSGDDLLQAIREKLEQRQPFYTQAQLTVTGTNITPQILQQAILEAKKT